MKANRLLLCAVLVACLQGCEQATNRVHTPTPATRKVQVAVFGASWCGPCHAKAPAVDAIERDARGRAKFFRFDVDVDTEKKQQFGVSGVPMYVVVVDGKEFGRTNDPGELRRLLGL
jgi:thiol-disulfide isomerase/thioredoxin